MTENHEDFSPLSQPEVKPDVGSEHINLKVTGSVCGTVFNSLLCVCT